MLRTLLNLIGAVAIGLVVSSFALFIAAIFSMGMALNEPTVVVPILVVGPALSVATWAFLKVKTRHAGSEQVETARVISKQDSSPLSKLFICFGGACLSLPLFIVVMFVENQFPGELRNDVFGPYHTHPFRPLSGIALCVLGLATAVFLNRQFKIRHVAIGLSFGSVALGLVLIFAH